MPVQRRGLSSKPTEEVVRARRLAMGLVTPESVRKLQTTLHAKAKDTPDYRFYTLYDKVYRSDVLTFAYRLCHANGGHRG
jgi:RNA-directed DNA polymerase